MSDGSASPTASRHSSKKSAKDKKDKKKVKDDLLGVLTRQDIDDAMAFFAQPDKNVVTREDIRTTLDAYFPHLPANYKKLLVDPPAKYGTTLNRTMNKEHLYHLFGLDDASGYHFDDDDEKGTEGNGNIHKSVLDSPRELEAYALLVPNKKGLVSDRIMKSILIQGYNKVHGNDQTPGAVTYLSYDKEAILSAFDFDHDGHISLDDIKAISATHEKMKADEARRQELTNRAAMENALKRRLSVSPGKFATQMSQSASPALSMSPTSNSSGTGQAGRSVTTSGENLKHKR